MENSKPKFWTVHGHDARGLDELLALESSPEQPLLTATITSPPYGATKDYGHAQQIGFGQSYDEYLEDMASILGRVHAHTRDDGSLWLIADSYRERGAAPRRLRPVPFDLSRVAEDAGWTLRDVVIWRKDRTLPWSNGTRLRNAFEYVLLLVKGPSPKYRLDRLRSPQDAKDWWIRFPERYSPDGMAPSNVWDIPIPVQGAWSRGELKHACPLPTELVRRLVLLSTDPGDVVFDPFAGSGVVVAEASRLGRRSFGCELLEQHISDFEKVVRPEIVAHTRDNGAATNQFRNAVLALRKLKVCRVIMERVARSRNSVSWPAAALVLDGGAARTKAPHGDIRVGFGLVGPRREWKRYEKAAHEATTLPPASKFGLGIEISVFPVDDLMQNVRGRRIYHYANGRVNRALGPIPHSDMTAVVNEALNDRIPPMFSDIEVDLPPVSDSEAIAIAANGGALTPVD